MAAQSRKVSCIYINVNAKYGKKHRDGKMNIKEKVEKLLAKALVSLKNHKTAFNLEMDGKRYYGRYMSHLKYEDGIVTFNYEDKKVSVKQSDIAEVRRLRTRKFLFFVQKAEKAEKSKEKVAEKTANTKKNVNTKKKANKDEV